MLIDWFTVGAQALNFLVLVWLMKRFLYKPILRAIDAREKRIAAELSDAAEKKAEAKKERDEFAQKNDDLEKNRAALLSQATEEAKTEKDKLLAEARSAAEATRAKQKEALENAARDLRRDVASHTQRECFAIVRKALMDLATTSLEERMGEVFTRRLREMSGDAKAGLGRALTTQAEPAIVRSAFDLPADQRAAIQNALNETFSASIRIRYETAPDLIAGIELSAGGRKVSWNLADYVTSIEKNVDELTRSPQKAETPTKSPSNGSAHASGS